MLLEMIGQLRHKVARGLVVLLKDFWRYVEVLSGNRPEDKQTGKSKLRLERPQERVLKQLGTTSNNMRLATGRSLRFTLISRSV